AIGGMPARESRNAVSATPRSGRRRASPADEDSAVCSSPPTHPSTTTANAPRTLPAKTPREKIAARNPPRGPPGQPNKEKPRLGDRRVREQPLDVGLGDREDASHDDRDRGEHAHEGPPVVGEREERDAEHAQERAERRHLRPRRHERRDARRGALV